MSAAPKPRVNYELLKAHTGKVVTLVGQVSDILEKQKQIKLLTTDNQTATVRSKKCNFYLNS